MSKQKACLSAGCLQPLLLALLVAVAAGCSKPATPPPVAGPQDGAHAVAFTPDGKLVAMWDWSHHLLVRDVATGQERASVPAEGGASPLAMAVLPDARLIATGHFDRSVKVWDPGAKGEPVVLSGHGSGVSTIAFSPDGKTLATGNNAAQGVSAEYRLWDVAGKSLLGAVTCKSGLSAMAFTPDGKTLIAGSLGEAKFLDPDTGQERGTVAGQPDELVSALAVSPDGARLAMGHADGMVLVCTVSPAKTVAKLKGHERPVRALAFSPDGKTLATGSEDRTARLWDVEAQQTKFVLQGHQSAVKAVSFCGDGNTLATGGADKLVKLWNVATGQEVGQAK
jgi:WD40 repeat protein